MIEIFQEALPVDELLLHKKKLKVVLLDVIL